MKDFLICYWTEKDDVCTDLEKLIEAVCIESALQIFKKSTVYKSISSISEIPNIERYVKKSNCIYSKNNRY